ncbi:hypothetical protein ACFXPA_48980, partial [Amycolatopsis sp. NPDC059090]|uniref:hypothetical protein n=1 Tax=Amycolatopsis sp. NPDC059090 TaxID=3346723 RepID=UPI00366BBED6
RLSEELKTTVVVPDGGFAVMPGVGLYAGAGAGGTGWQEFSPGRPARPAGPRFPAPAWESWCADRPIEVAGTVAEPVQCGLLVRRSGTHPSDPAGPGEAASVDPRFPQIVVGDGRSAPSPSAVAAILRSLPSERVLVVPASAEAATHAWQVELAMRLGRNIVFSSGPQARAAAGLASTAVLDETGAVRFRPFATVLCQPPGPGDQAILDIAPAPPGWVASGRRSYRLRDGGPVTADVVPSGLVLRCSESGPGDTATEAAPFDPVSWTLTLGVRGRPVGLPVLAAAERLLETAGPAQRQAARIQVAGTLDREAAEALDRWAGSARSPLVPAESPAPRAIPSPAVAAPASAAVRAADRPTTAGDGRAAAGSRQPASGPAVSPPIMTTSASPVSTVSGPATTSNPEPEPGVRDDSGARQEFRVVDREGEPVGEVSQLGRPRPPRGVLVPEKLLDQSPAAYDRARTVTVPLPEEPLNPRAVADRPSNSAEQLRFTESAGDYFGEALATVNAALATWPSMRLGESAGTKADFVAVCLYLGQSLAGAAAVNNAVRGGRPEPMDGQVACLASGLRRLPTHRRAVLRQGRAGSIEHGSVPGTVLAEPGFLTAGADLDATAPGADLDVLIWPSTARRTSELMLNRPFDEVVFLAGSRFKALAVRRAAETGTVRDNEPAAPRVAALFRELAPDETPSGTGLDEPRHRARARELSGRAGGASPTLRRF